MMPDRMGIGHDPGQHAADVGGWIKALKEDPREIFRAASDAEKIKIYLTDLQQDRNATQLIVAMEWRATAPEQIYWYARSKAAGRFRLAKPRHDPRPSNLLLIVQQFLLVRLKVTTNSDGILKNAELAKNRLYN